MRRTWLLGIGLLLWGCGANGAVTRAAGSWLGQFDIESVAGKSDPAAIQAEAMKGNLELYVNGSKFKLDMKSAHQGFTVNGKWTADKGRVTMTTDSYHFDNPTEEDQKALNLRIITPDEIRAVFGHPVVLDETADRRHLTGLKTSLGRLLGRFEFERPIPH
ncbi:MAG TPA: hypothetical protein VHE55_01195 [Fimbriimonadaceae bacterium]|nr:hypothetical protein [Fimbriimonadaceae bacterium]